ncbi:uncharacterized protein BYT42DRAFT_551454 [Radiomyces spectabilis]|uniref:uncharacterized protein n=1 Tax=Radiomyces spectabilis TaxID=64574 RepID=UPI002220181B|nr:uncharacterized protein BYT42DRAFT_551454 [Radiomyces spectabilis]KAI8393558.1 hypothetical protein BYT42DRAFT_551454 [Radiomyces spectabilis]
MLLYWFDMGFLLWCIDRLSVTWLFQLLATTCLHLACKSTEVPRKVRDLVNVGYRQVLLPCKNETYMNAVKPYTCVLGITIRTTVYCK